MYTHQMPGHVANDITIDRPKGRYRPQYYNMEDLKTLLTSMDRLMIQKLNKEAIDLTQTINK